MQLIANESLNDSQNVFKFNHFGILIIIIEARNKEFDNMENMHNFLT